MDLKIDFQDALQQVTKWIQYKVITLPLPHFKCVTKTHQSMRFQRKNYKCFGRKSATSGLNAAFDPLSLFVSHSHPPPIYLCSQSVSNSWQTVADHVKTTEFTVRDLRPNTVYLFIIRAVNTQGLGDPSPMSEPVRSQGTQQRGHTQCLGVTVAVS